MSLQAERAPLLRAFIDDQEFARVYEDQVPCESTATLRWSGLTPVLRVVDSDGTSLAYDFASLAKEGDTAAFSLRVGPHLVVQCDCLIGKGDPPTAEEFLGGKVLGVRLQPFFLPGSGLDPSSLHGHGLFGRGLHYPGIVTPGNVSLLCVCDSCRGGFRLQSFHAGFSGLAYFYCSSGHHTLVVSAQAPGAPALLGEASPDSLRAFESTLPECTICGGNFAYRNSLRCPQCRAPYIDFEKYPNERAGEYYGNYFYGESLQRWPVAGDGGA